MLTARRWFFRVTVCGCMALTWPLLGRDAQESPVRVVPALTGIDGAPVAPESLALVVGTDLALGRWQSDVPSIRLGSHGVTVVDARGVHRPAPLVSVAPSEIRFLVPHGTTPGRARVDVRHSDGTVQTGWVDVRAVAPSLLPPDAEEIPAPATSREVSLVASGIRHALSPVTVMVNGRPVRVRTIPDGHSPGLDRLDLGPLPRLDRAGDAVSVTLVADGLLSNTVQLPLATRVPSGGWGLRAPLIEPNSEMSVAALDGKIYVLGGYPSNRISVRTVQVYDPTTDTWSLTTPLPVALNHTVAAGVAGRLYVIGGQEEAGGAGPFVDTVYAYDPATAAWSSRARMPAARGGGAAAVVDGLIYVAGGRPPRGNDFAVYDPGRDRWTVLPPLPTQRNHLGAAAVGGRIYVVGGRFGAGFESERTDAIEIFDPGTGRWSTGAPMLRPRGGVNVARAYGCLHVFGGEGDASSPTGVFPDHDVYDPSTDNWISMPPMPLPVHGVTGAVVPTD